MTDPNQIRSIVRVKLHAASDQVEELRSKLLFSADEHFSDDNLTDGAAPHYLIAMSLLEQAKQHLLLAAIEQERGS